MQQNWVVNSYLGKRLISSSCRIKGLSDLYDPSTDSVHFAGSKESGKPTVPLIRAAVRALASYMGAVAVLRNRSPQTTSFVSNARRNGQGKSPSLAPESRIR